jgi:hypothetical protein
MNSNTTHSGISDDFETELRSRLMRLADHAPSTVRMPGEVSVQQQPQRRRRAGGITAAIAALVGGIGITTVALQGAGEGGAASPEAAVTALVEAFNEQDLIGMVDILDPTEVGAVRGALDSLNSEAKRLELLGDGFALDSVGGVDLEISDLSLTAEPIAADLSVVVATGGNLGASFDPATFPAGSTIRDLMAGVEPVQSSVELVDVDPRVMVATVRRDGRWYVSLAYTIAEYARQGSDVPFPTVDAVTPEGFDTPEAAATALYTRLVTFDLAGAVATAAPGEGDALLRYASLWLPGATDAAQQARAGGWELTLDSISLNVSGDGSRRVVTPSAFSIGGTVSSSVALNASMPPLDPSLPTQIYLWGSASEAYVVIPAGQPVPESVEGLPTLTFDQLLEQYGDTPFNYTSAGPTGEVVPFQDVSAEANAPLPLAVQYEGGCTTIEGDGAVGWLNPQYNEAWNDLGDGRWQICESSPLGIVSVFAIGLGGGSASLPSVSTVEVDGRWYVSPIASATASIIDTMRSVDSPSSIFDSPLGVYVYGVTRQALASYLQGSPVAELTAECAALVVAVDGVVTDLVDGITGQQARACYLGGVTVVSETPASATFETVPGDTVPGDTVLVETGPASTVPGETGTVDTVPGGPIATPTSG